MEKKGKTKGPAGAFASARGRLEVGFIDLEQSREFNETLEQFAPIKLDENLQSSKNRMQSHYI